MGKTREDADASPITMKKKSKKNKNEVSDLSDVDGEVNSKKELVHKRKRDDLVEVFLSLETYPEKRKTKVNGLRRGKRFTPEEDEIIKEAVNNYITDNNMGEDGLEMVMNSSSPGMKKYWKEIGKCIPYRPDSAVYHRAHSLFERTKTPCCTPEETETLKEYYGKYANKWKKIAELLEKKSVAG